MSGHRGDNGRCLCSVERMTALSDGVVAIVLTLLVLELKLPELPARTAVAELAHDLAQQGPVLWAWIISFLLTARFWQEHHVTLARVRRCDGAAVGINFVFLGLLSLIPFASHLAGDHPANALSVFVFSATIALTAVALAAFAGHVRRRRLHGVLERPDGLGDHGNQVDHDLDDRDLGRQTVYLGVVMPVVALATIGLALVGAEALALGVWGVEILAKAVSGWHRS